MFQIFDIVAFRKTAKNYSYDKLTQKSKIDVLLKKEQQIIATR